MKKTIEITAMIIALTLSLHAIISGDFEYVLYPLAQSFLGIMLAIVLVDAVMLAKDKKQRWITFYIVTATVLIITLIKTSIIIFG